MKGARQCALFLLRYIADSNPLFHVAETKKMILEWMASFDKENYVHSVHSTLQNFPMLFDMMPLYADVGATQVPVTLVWGDSDHITPHVCAEELMKRIPLAKLEIIPNSGHGPFTTKPREVAAVVVKHLLRNVYIFG